MEVKTGSENAGDYIEFMLARYRPRLEGVIYTGWPVEPFGGVKGALLAPFGCPKVTFTGVFRGPGWLRTTFATIAPCRPLFVRSVLHGYVRLPQVVYPQIAQRIRYC